MLPVAKCDAKAFWAVVRARLAMPMVNFGSVEPAETLHAIQYPKTGNSD